jgi:hypothetical protein
MRRIVITLAALALATTLAAQQRAPDGWTLEVRPFAGAFVPTGGLGDVLKTDAMFGVQGAIGVRPKLHIVGTFAWIPGQTKLVVADQDVNIYQYDLGIEYTFTRSPLWGWELRPFAGIGAGGRGYDYASDALLNSSCTAGYGALGTELQMGRAALHVEARDYVHCFKSPIERGESSTRNDLRFAFGVAYHFR